MSQKLFLPDARFSFKMHQIQFCGSSQLSPSPLAGFRGRGREKGWKGKEREKKGKGWERERGGKEVKTPGTPIINPG